MTTKYAVYNPTNGESILVDTEEQATELFWGFMIQLALPYFHNTPYMLVEQNEDSSEVWKNIDTDVIEKPKTFAEIALLVEANRKIEPLSNPTPVETLP